MAEKTTFIKIDRNILNWRWYQNANTMRVFLHLLLTANIADKDFEKITIHRGEKLTTYDKIAFELDLSPMQVRTAIQHLKDTGELTVRKYPKYQVIAIENYDRYQQYQQPNNSQITGNQQSDNRQLTGNQQQLKNNKNKRSIRRSKEYVRGEIPPTREQVAEYCAERHNGIDAQRFIDFYEARGWMLGKSKMKDWQAAVRTWERRESAGEGKKRDETDELLERAAEKGYWNV